MVVVFDGRDLCCRCCRCWVLLFLLSNLGTRSEKAKAAGAPAKADISKLEPGAMITVEWRGKPVFVLSFAPQTVADLEKMNDKVRENPTKHSSLNMQITWRARSTPRRYFGAVGSVYSSRLRTYVSP